MRIEVVAHKDQPIEAFGADFDSAGGSIGREQGNTLVLPDMERHISRVHAEVVFRSGVFVLVDQGTAIPVHVNERALGKGREFPLSDGDTVRIGSYVMKVRGKAPSRGAPTLSTPLPVVRPVAVPVASVSDDPFEGLLGSPPQNVAPTAPAPEIPAVREPVATASGTPPQAPTGAVGSAYRIPEELDIFGETVKPLGHDVAGRFPDVGNPIDITSEEDFKAVDQLIGNANTQGTDRLGPSAPLVGAVFDKATVEGSVDPLVIFGIAAPPVAVPAHPQSNHAPEIEAAFLPPVARPDPALFPPSQAPVAAISPTVAMDRPDLSHDALLAAFLNGSGLASHEFIGPVTPEFMRLLGQLLREATQGTLDLLQARAATKREFHAEQTLIQGQNNNPLKFSPNVEEALAHLLSRRSGAYVAAGQAMREAYNDLRSHQVGFVAGVEAALAGVLARFNPDELEQRLSQRSVLESLLPMARKAKLWDLLEELYGDIAKDAEDDFHHLFTKEFLRAYHKQISELQRQQRLKGQD